MDVYTESLTETCGFLLGNVRALDWRHRIFPTPAPDQISRGSQASPDVPQKGLIRAHYCSRPEFQFSDFMKPSGW